MTDIVEEPVHFHTWYMEPQDMSCERCNCGCILVSQKEYDRRLEEYHQYYQACQTTKAHALVEEMKAAIKGGYKKDMHEEILKVRAKIAELTHLEKNEYGDEHPVPNETEVEQFKPFFPDPDGFKN